MPEVTLHTTLFSKNGDDKTNVLEKLSQWAISQGWRIEEEESNPPLKLSKKHSTRQLTDSAALLQSIVDASLTGISVYKAIRDENNVIIDFEWVLHNKALKQYNDGRDLVGKRCLDEYPGLKESGMFARYVKVIEENVPQDFEVHYANDGLDNWRRIVAVKLGDGIVTSTEDITTRKKAEQAIFQLKDEAAQKATDRYYAIFNSIDEGFCIIQMLYDREGKPIDWIYLDVNPTFERQSGFNPKGRKVSEAIGDVEAFWLNFYNSVLQTRQPARTENYVGAINRWYKIYASPLEGAEHLLAVVFDDITERKQTEERQLFLLKLNDALRSLPDPLKIQAVAADLLGEHLKANQSHYGETIGEFIYISHSHGDGLPPMTGKFRHLDFGERLVEGFRKGKVQVCYDTATDPTISQDERGVLASAHIGAYVAMPLVKGGEWVATLAVHNIEPRLWKESEIELVQEVAERSWAAVERARAEEALRINEERMRRQKEAFLATVNGATLDHSLNVLTSMVINETKGEARTAFYIANAEGTALYNIRGAGNMPDAYADEIDGFLIGEDSLACGLAVPTGLPVLTSDIFEEPRWKPWTSVAEKYGYRGCWSFPIKTKENKAVGTFAMYFQWPREATPKDIELADIVTQTAAVIISRHSETQERIRAEEALQQSQTQLAEEMADTRQLQHTSSQLIDEDNIDALYDQILDAAIAIMDSDMGSIQLLSSEKNELLLLTYKGFSPESAKTWKWITLESTTSCGMAFAKGARVVVSDVHSCKSMFDAENFEAFRLSGIKAVQSTPLVSRTGKILGMLSTHWRSAHEPAERELSLLDVLARQMADLIERKQAQDELKEFNASLEQQIAERTHELKESKAFIEEVTSTVPDLITIYDVVTDKILYANHDAFWGAEDEGASLNLRHVERVEKLIHFDDQEKVKAFLEERKELLDGEIKEVDLRTASGERWIRLKSKVFSRNSAGEAALIISLITDITDRKLSEIKINEQSNFIERVVSNVPETVFIFDLREQRNVFANPEVEILLGYTPAEMQAFGIGVIQRLVYPDDWNIQAGLLAALSTLEDGEIQDSEYRVVHKNGSIRWVQVRRGVFRRNKEGGVEQIIAILHDITQLKNAEQELKEEHYFLEQVTNKTPHLIYVFDLEEQRFTYINKRVNELIGQTEEYVYAMGPHLFQAIIHPEDLPKRTTYMNEMTTLAEGEVRELEFRIWVGKGFRCFRTKDSIFKKENGVVKQVIGIGEDITLEKLMEEQAKKGKGHIGLN
ncbi:PAS domain S-box protein [Flavisolibacter tropicus]|nr:GAF domain-containing protein [Flavisolibacter tropicus]